MTDPKKVLIVVENNFPPRDPRVWYEALTLRDAGWQVIVICPTAPESPIAPKEPENLEGVLLYRFTPGTNSGGLVGYAAEYGRAFWAIARLSWRVWREQGFDAIHLCNPPDIFFPIALFFRLRGARVIFDHHDLFPEMIQIRYNSLPGKLMYAVARATEFLTFRTAHIVLSTNESYRRVAMKRGHKPPDAVFTVRNGPRLSEFVPVPPDPALKQGSPHMACYAGVMGQQDGLTDLLNAIHHMVNDLGRRDILFTLLGDGEARPEALATIDRWGFSDVVSMPGMIHNRDLLRRYLASADVCLSPEPYNKLNAASTFIKIGEYMAMGRPVVCYDLPESRCTAQEAAIYAAPGDPRSFGQAIATLIDDPERRERMGAAGRERVTTCLAWEHQSHNLLAAYEVIKGQSSRTANPESPREAGWYCQLLSLPATSEKTLRLPLPLTLRLKLAIKRRLTPKQQTVWRKRLRAVAAYFGVNKAGDRRHVVIPAVTMELKPGDFIRVRELEEIRSTLDEAGRLRGCSFMPEMERFCGTKQRVLKCVARFLDERDYRVKQTGGLVILDGVMCEGTAEFGRCDRSCFFFWRQEWLEKVESAPDLGNHAQV